MAIRGRDIGLVKKYRVLKKIFCVNHLNLISYWTPSAPLLSWHPRQLKQYFKSGFLCLGKIPAKVLLNKNRESVLLLKWVNGGWLFKLAVSSILNRAYAKKTSTFWNQTNFRQFSSYLWQLGNIKLGEVWGSRRTYIGFSQTQHGFSQIAHPKLLFVRDWKTPSNVRRRVLINNKLP